MLIGLARKFISLIHSQLYELQPLMFLFGESNKFFLESLNYMKFVIAERTGELNSNNLYTGNHIANYLYMINDHVDKKKCKFINCVYSFYYCLNFLFYLVSARTSNENS